MRVSSDLRHVGSRRAFTSAGLMSVPIGAPVGGNGLAVRKGQNTPAWSEVIRYRLTAGRDATHPAPLAGLPRHGGAEVNSRTGRASSGWGLVGSSWPKSASRRLMLRAITGAWW